MGSGEVQGGLRNSGVSPWFLIRMISYRKSGEPIWLKSSQLNAVGACASHDNHGDEVRVDGARAELRWE